MEFCGELTDRVKRVQERLELLKLDALYVTNPKNILYLTGRESGRVLLTQNRAFLWVRDLYREVYGDLYSKRGYPFDVRVYDSDSIVEKVKSLRFRKLGVENVNVEYFKNIRRRFKCKLKVAEIVEEERSVKTSYELRMLEKSASIAVKGMEKARAVVKPGVRELEAVAEIEKTIRKLGSETPPFNEGMLLSAGKNSADIHAHARTGRIKKGPVLVDLGARYNGYYSDMTRTLAAGRLNKKERQLMEFVRNLELEAIDTIQPGTKASKVYDFIESRMKEKNLDFHHSAGHGVGLEVHERPGLGLESEDVLKENMVFTVEPGIYLPHKFGIRFEDMVLLTKKGCRMLTR